MHRVATTILSSALIVLGLTMFLTAVGRGGGPLATGVVLGVLFMIGGGLRLWAARQD